jgi:hypothetical protein
MNSNAQASLKQQLISVAKSMYYSIHLKAHLTEYLAQENPAKYSPEGMAESAEVDIVLPSIPDAQQIIDWYKNGWFKYESLIESLATKHCIPIESFETKPKLSVAELAGEFADSSPPAAKKPKK